MTSQEFIRRCTTGEEPQPRTGWKQVGSIGWDGRHVYSYGTHYPLLIALEIGAGQVVYIRNDRGYSSTTGKHISWAGPYAAGHVEIPRTVGATYATSPEGIKESAQQEIRDRQNEIVALDEKIAARPRYAASYRAAQDRVCDRITNLRHVISLADQAIAYAKNN